MKHERCNGDHNDTTRDRWRDTAGRWWRELECTKCGRLFRQRQP